MRIAYFDCFSGISGDMTIGALLDAGLSFEDLRTQLALLNVQGYEISVEKVKKRGFGGTKFHVLLGDAEPHHRGLHDIAAIIHASALDATVQERTPLRTMPLMRIFSRPLNSGWKPAPNSSRAPTLPYTRILPRSGR